MRFDEFRSQHGEIDVAMDELTSRVIGAAIEVHQELGAGLAESHYELAPCHELQLRGIPFERQASREIQYKGHPIGTLRIDLLIAGTLIIELKSCESLNQLHRAQLITYLYVTGYKLGLLINFNVAILKDGIKRVIRSS